MHKFIYQYVPSCSRWSSLLTDREKQLKIALKCQVDSISSWWRQQSHRTTIVRCEYRHDGILPTWFFLERFLVYFLRIVNSENLLEHEYISHVHAHWTIMHVMWARLNRAKYAHRDSVDDLLYSPEFRIIMRWRTIPKIHIVSTA